MKIRTYLPCSLALVVVLAGLQAPAWAAVDRDRSQAFYEEALEHFKSERITEATIQLRNALQQDPGNLPARILLGQALLAEDQARHAIKELEKARELGADENLVLIPLAQAYMAVAEPERVLTSMVSDGHKPQVDGELKIIQAEAYMVMGELKGAEEELIAASVLLPVDPRPLLGRAQIAMAREDRAKADKLMDQATRLAPESADVWMFKAIMHRDSGEFEQAAKAFERVLELRPVSVRALTARAAMWMDIGRVDAAKADLDKARGLQADSLEATYLRTLIMFREGKQEEARQMLRERADSIRQIKEDYRAKVPNTKLMLGVVAYFEGNYDEAITHLQAFLNVRSGHPGAKRYLASAYLEKQEWDNVIRLFRARPGEEPPNDPTTLSLLAEAYRARGDFKMAEQHYEAALQLAPDAAGLGVRLAMSRLDAGRARQAVADLERLVERFPDFGEARAQLARVYVKIGRTPDAREEIEALLKLAPDNAQLHNMAGAIALAAGDTAAARRYIDKASLLDAQLILPKLNLARLELMEGHMPRAETRYRSLLEEHPFHVEAGLELADLLIGQGEYSEAEERIGRVLETEPGNFKAHLAKLRALRARGAEAATLQAGAYELEKNFPERPEASLAVAEVYADTGDAGQARVHVRRAVEKAEFDTDVLLRASRLQQRLGDGNGALWALTKARQASPANREVGTALVGVLLELRDFEQARALLDELKETHGEMPSVLVAEGDWLMAYERFDEAIVNYARAFEISPNPASVRTLFRARIIADDFSTAEQLVRQWISEHPKDIGTRRMYAHALLNRQQWDAARRVYEGIREAGFEDVLLLNNLASLYQMQGDKRALPTIKLAYEQAPEDPAVIDTYGWILTESGKPAEGLALLREAFARSSTSPEIRYHISVALMKLGRHDQAREELEAALDTGKPFAGEDTARAMLTRLRSAAVD